MSHNTKRTATQPGESLEREAADIVVVSQEQADDLQQEWLSGEVAGRASMRDQLVRVVEGRVLKAYLAHDEAVAGALRDIAEEFSAMTI